jgi:hypothetical protein
LLIKRGRVRRGEVEALPPSGLTDEWRGGLPCGGGGSMAVGVKPCGSKEPAA